MVEISYDDFRRMKKPAAEREHIVKDFILRSLEEQPYTCEELKNKGKREDVFERPIEDLLVHQSLNKLCKEGIVEKRIGKDEKEYFGLTNFDSSCKP